MNYFKGSGSCGLSTAPSFKKIKSDMEKTVLSQNILIQKNNVNINSRVAGKA
ncbi:MAG: hypothetical protein HND53_11490 [Proteobacteria bacterium]|nr:hypothetical protein [Pseudomonadota bacterium]